jgi:metallophosphoesterase superfamily enzyme
VRHTSARRLIILGDFVHAPLPIDSIEFNELQNWLRQLAGYLEIHVVIGNHDIGAVKTHLPAVQWWETELINHPFRFIHDAQRARSLGAEALFTLSGHVHPVKRLREVGKSALRVPVFWQRARGLILPSFGVFTGGFAVMPDEGDHMFAVGSRGIVPLG